MRRRTVHAEQGRFKGTSGLSFNSRYDRMEKVGWRGSIATSKVSVQTRTAVLLPETEAQEDLLHAS